jgi:hypothetical protein
MSTDAGLAHLSRLKSLETVNLTGTKVTAEGARFLQHALPKAHVSIAP